MDHCYLLNFYLVNDDYQVHDFDFDYMCMYMLDFCDSLDTFFKIFVDIIILNRKIIKDNCVLLFN